MFYMRNLFLVCFLATGLLFSCTSSSPEQEQSITKETNLAPLDDPAFDIDPFKISSRDDELSPYTGMDREEWKRAGIHILKGAFQYVDDFEEPMFLPKFPGKSYPYNGDYDAIKGRSSAIFEALARTFNVASPILAENPDLELNGIKLIDYYKYHFLQLLTNPECDYYIGDKPKVPSQPTCELGNLSMWNLLQPDVFWNRLTNEEKDKVAERISAWGHSFTNGHNWRYFNVMMLSFLHKNGYSIDQKVMLSHIDNLIMRYAGDGHYQDGHGFDYYTVHVYHLYNPVWLNSYGYEFAPERAKIIEGHVEDFHKKYPLIFGKGGEVNMFGRSIIYRLGASAAAASPFLVEGLGNLDPGEARRIASSALLQFISHPEFFNKGIPALGFYGPFEPAVQRYSCSASPYWMFLSFSALTLPVDHPFWTANEELGHWADIDSSSVLSEYFQGSGLLISNHGEAGTSEIRTSKIHTKNPNYAKMVYNTAFPWSADAEDGIVSALLTVKHDFEMKDIAVKPAHADLAGYRDNVLYKHVRYDYEKGHPTFVDMASYVIPGGEIRIERIRKIRKTQAYLGHFELAYEGERPKKVRKEIDGKEVLLLKSGEKQLAITNYIGWKEIAVNEHIGVHVETEKSVLPYLVYEDLKYLSGPVDLAISILLHKTNDMPWSDDELQPIASIKALKEGVPLHLGGLTIKLKNGEEFTVDYGNIDAISTRY